MNLINRDVLAEYISENEKAFVYAIKHKDMTMLEDVILDIPIAYDVDKVMERLEALKAEKEMGSHKVMINEAIEIVKAGKGIDE